jgi:CPA2 family monovalent cation:H+ antiporter-2
VLSTGADISTESLLFLATAGVIVPLFRRLHVSPVHGFLLAGALLGPYGLGSLAQRLPWLESATINNVGEVSQVADLGVVFLLFIIGLELSFERLVSMRRLLFGLGAMQLIGSAAALALIAWACGQSAGAAVTLGAALAQSSTAIALPVLAEKKRLHLVAGRASFAILLFQDLAAAPLLFMVAMLASKQSGGILINLASALAPAAIAVAALVIMGRVVLRPLFIQVAKTGSTELFMAACLFVILSTAYATAAAGQSMALGAFIAGLLLSGTEFRHQIEVLMDPFKGLLLGLFFLSVGTELNFPAIGAHPFETLAVAAGLIGVKTAVMLPVGRLSGLKPTVSREVALTVAAGGEFGFAMLTAAMLGGVVSIETGSVAIAAITISMLTTPFLVGFAARLAPRLPAHIDLEALAPPAAPGEAEIVIAGYSRVGALIGDMLKRHGVPFIAIDSRPGLVARERKHGTPIYYGDPTHPELLHRCGIETAKALVVTMDSLKVVDQVVAAAQKTRDDLVILARARDENHAAALHAFGVVSAVPEALAASLQLSRTLLLELGVPAVDVVASIRGRRDEGRQTMRPGSNDDPQRKITRHHHP